MVSLKKKKRVNTLIPLYLLFDEIDGFIEEKEERKHLIIAVTDSNSEVLKIYAEI